MTLPLALASSAWARRVAVAKDAAESAGAALMRLRSAEHVTTEKGDQLKTSADAAAEGWVLGLLRSAFPGEEILSEEEFETAGREWHAPDAYWTVDALDGTRSYVDGFAGFCVQMAYVERGEVKVGVVHEPALEQTYVGARGAGAFLVGRETTRELRVQPRGTWPDRTRFVDSTVPREPVGILYERHGGVFVELGSIGLKICRIADDSADVFIKKLTFKLWDVAPAEVVLAEAGARVGTWDGRSIPYAGRDVRFANILAAPEGLFDAAAAELRAIPGAVSERT